MCNSQIYCCDRFFKLENLLKQITSWGFDFSFSSYNFMYKYVINIIEKVGEIKQSYAVGFDLDSIVILSFS